MDSLGFHKRGDTFELLCLYTDEADQPVDLTNVTVRSQLRTRDRALVATLVYAPLDQTQPATRGRYTLRAEAAQVATWPLGETRGDIEYTESGTVTSTDTFTFKVVEGETEPA